MHDIYPNGYTWEYDSYTNIVPGGYILSFSRREFDITSLDKLGTFKINIFEKNVEKLGTEKGDTSDPRLYAKAYDYSVENGETIYVTYEMIDYSDPRYKADWE